MGFGLAGPPELSGMARPADTENQKKPTADRGTLGESHPDDAMSLNDVAALERKVDREAESRAFPAVVDRFSGISSRCARSRTGGEAARWPSRAAAPSGRR